MGFLQWLSGKELACQYRSHRFDPWVRKIPWRRKWQPTPVFLPRKPHGQRCLVGCIVHGVTEPDTTEQLKGNNGNTVCYTLCDSFSVTRLTMVSAL